MKKPGWGTRLVFGMGAFMLLLVSLMVVVISNKQEIVVDDYYPRDLKHQTMIDMKNNYAMLGQPVVVFADLSGLMITMPQKLRGQRVSGSLWFYSPADKSSDFELPLAPDSSGRQLVPAALLVRNRYLLKMTWVSGQTAYYHETEIDPTPRP